MKVKLRVYWLSWAAVGFACVASAVQSFAPLWFFITLILISQITTGIGIFVVTRRAKKQELLWKMEKAFGKPNGPQQVEHRQGKGPMVAYPPAQPPNPMGRGTRGRF